MRAGIAISTLFLVLACSPAPAEPDLEAEKSALMQASRNWAATLKTGNVDSMLSYWSDDAIVLPPDQAAVVGKEAIRAYVSGMLAIPGFTITWEPELAVVSASGDIGYMIERSSASFSDSTGASVTQLAKTVTVWRKNAEGQWKCVVDAWSNVPAHPVLSAR
jgi:ketosteroid isomerase-like protein